LLAGEVVQDREAERANGGSVKNSTKKGDDFERRVQRELSSSPAFRHYKRGWVLQWRRKPRYFSRDRDKEIEFDLSAEFRAGPTDRPYLTIVVECKDYGKPIGVDDIEEFESKLRQCFGVNVKGVVFSTNSFQPSAERFASARGIGLVRLFDDDSMSVVLHYIADPKGSDEEVQSDGFDDEYEDDEEAEELRVAAYDKLTDEHEAGLRTAERIYDTFGVFGTNFCISIEEVGAELLRSVQGIRWSGPIDP